MQRVHEVVVIDGRGPQYSESYGSFIDHAEACEVRDRVTACCGPQRWAVIRPMIADESTR